MKTFMYKEKENYIQRKCKKIEEFDTKYEELVEDIRNDRYVPNDFIILFQRLNQSNILDLSKVYDYLMYHALDIVAASEYVSRYLHLYHFSKNQEVMSPEDMDERLFSIRNNTFGSMESRKNYQEYASAIPNMQVLQILQCIPSEKKMEKPKFKIYQ